MKKFSVLAAIVFLCSCFWQIPVQAEGGRWTRFVSDSPSGYMYDELLYEEDGECEGIMVLGVCAFPNLSGIGMENYKVDYEIPAVVDGKTVIGIGKGIRDEFQRANTIIISDGIREIGEQSFLYKNRIPLLCVVLVCILCAGVTVAVILSRKRRQITACAEEEMPVNYCPSCGRKARPGDRYCRGCGKSLE